MCWERCSPRRDADLFLHEVDDPYTLFGHAMLDLDAGVHLHEVKAALLVHEKLHGADVLVIDRLRQLDRSLAPSPCGAIRRGTARGLSSTIFWLRRWMEQSRSLQVHHAPVAVRHHLELDVARVSPPASRSKHPRCRTPFRPRCARRGSPGFRLTSLCAARIPRPAAATRWP